MSAQLLAGWLVSGPAQLQAQAEGTPADCPRAEPPPVVAERALAHIAYLADDALEGRAVGTRGARCAAAYLVSRFQELALLPGADGGWYQTFPVRNGSTLAGPGALEISGDVHESGKAWRPYGFSGSGDVSGRLVYGGPGVSAPGQDEDRYAHLPLDGTIAVVEALSPGVSGMRADPHFKATIAAGRRAAGLLILLPENTPLPEMGRETRPFLDIPVAAVTGAAAETVREAARRGASARIAVRVRPIEVEANNVVALLAGSDPSLESEVIVVGAHFDHLGYGGMGSLAPGTRAIHNGADDNASGTSAVIEIAAALSADPRPARSVLFIAFAGEERGLLGSSFYVANPLRPLARTVAMINLDMVGRLEGGALTVNGTGTAAEWETLLAEANAAQPSPLPLNPLPDGYGPSDHAAFYGAGVPVLHFFSGTHADYHRPSDDVDRVDAQGLRRIIALTTDLVALLAGTEAGLAATLTPVEGAGGPHGVPDQSVAPQGYGPYFGSIPDMTPQEFGVRITGVREDSPARESGLRAGDVIIEFGGMEVKDLYAYTYALREHAPGEEVVVVVIRDDSRVTLRAVLSERR